MAEIALVAIVLLAAFWAGAISEYLWWHVIHHRRH